MMKRVFATLGIGVALALAAAPANADQGPGDPRSTNCDAIARLAAQGVPGVAISPLAGTTIGQSPTTIFTLPVQFIPSSGGCTIAVNPHP
jgi:hypothetical protein